MIGASKMNHARKWKWLGLQVLVAASTVVGGASYVSANDSTPNFERCPEPEGTVAFVACYSTPAWCWDTVGNETNECYDFGCLEDQDNCPGSTGQVALWSYALGYPNMP
jgi:hypothetical protein